MSKKLHLCLLLLFSQGCTTLGNEWVSMNEVPVWFHCDIDYGYTREYMTFLKCDVLNDSTEWRRMKLENLEFANADGVTRLASAEDIDGVMKSSNRDDQIADAILTGIFIVGIVAASQSNAHAAIGIGTAMLASSQIHEANESTANRDMELLVVPPKSERSFKLAFVTTPNSPPRECLNVCAAEDVKRCFVVPVRHVKEGRTLAQRDSVLGYETPLCKNSQ